MPSKLKWLPKPKMMRIKYGRGHLKAKVVATYTRYIDGKKHTSHHIKSLDRKRTRTTKQWNKKLHHTTEHFTDSPMSFI
jgi:hypothetical protein